MTDIKKVTTTSVSPQQGEKKVPKKKKTIRLILTLPESNEKSCPEFNYGDLLSQHLYRRLNNHRLGDVINGPPRDKGEPYASEEDEALKALARSFEKKYGGGGAAGTPKRKKRKKENDFKQLGEGYDESDPFIDNSDAVDDVLPTNVETKFGGFYINSGELNFEEVQMSEDEKSNDSQVQSVKRKRKNEIVSSEDEGEAEAEDEKSDSGGEDEEGNKIRENGVLKVKKRKLDEGEILRKRKKMIDKFNAKKQKQKEETSENEAEPPKVNEVPEPKPPKEEVKLKVAGDTSIAASIEAVVTKAREIAKLQEVVPEEKPEEEEEKAEKEVIEEEEYEEDDEEEEEKEEREDGSSSESSSSSSSSDTSSSDSESEEDKEDKESEKETEKKTEEVNEDVPVPVDDDNDHLIGSDNERDNCLPADLPQDIIAVIDKLKEVGKNSKASSQKFFTDSVNKMLLSIELKLCRYGSRKKSLIYGHLSQHLPCGTQTLLKRSKNLLVEKLDERLKAPTQKLKEALDKVMPPLVEDHALECQKLAENKGENGEEHVEEEDAADESKKRKLPKKKFEISPDIRELLCDLVKVRCQGWHMIKKRSETAEEHVKSFIDSHIKNLWPKGWITTKILYKESQSAHSLITSKPSISKKVIVLGGGVVSNANSTGTGTTDMQVSTETESDTKPIVNDTDHPVVPSNDDDQKLISPTTSASVTKPLPEMNQKHTASISQNKSDMKESVVPVAASVKPNCDKDVKDLYSKPLSNQSTKINAAKPSLSTPSKNIVKDVQHISPISDSSQKSFHGFESPNKVLDIHKVVNDSCARQSLIFDATKKQITKNTQESLPPVREGKPPKPSLTATALPKISIASSITFSNSDTLKKVYGDHIDVPKTTKDDRKTITCISIKSVEKINEAVNVTSKTSKNKDREKCTNIESKEKKVLSAGNKKPDESVRIIDLVSEEDGLKKRKNVEKMQNISPTLNVGAESGKKPVSISISKLSPTTKLPIESSNKNNKLEQEMDHVMNELLQISKKNMKSSEKDETGNKQVIHSILDGNKSSYHKTPLDHEVVNLVKQSQQQTNIHSQASLGNMKTSSNSDVIDLSKSSTQTVRPPKTSPYLSDSTEIKNYQRQNSSQQPQKLHDYTALQQSSHSSSSHYGSAHSISRVSSHNLPFVGQQSNSGARAVQNGSGNTYQSSQNSSRNSASHEPYNRAPTVSTTNSSSHGISTVSTVSHRTSPSIASSQLAASSPRSTTPNSSSSFNFAQASIQSGNDRSIPTAHINTHKTSIQSGNHRTSPQSQSGNYKSSSSHSGSRRSPSTHSGSHRNSPSSHSGNRRSSPSTHSGSRKTSPSTHSGSHKSSPSSHGKSHRSSPSTHTGSRKSSPSTHSNSRRTPPSTTNVSQPITSPQSRSSHTPSHRLSTSHSASQGTVSVIQTGTSSLHTSLSREPAVAHVKDLSTSGSGSRASQIGQGGISHSSSQNISQPTSSNKSSTLDPKSSSYTHSVPSRPSKPSHNIEGLLYHNSPSKTSTAIDLTQSSYSQPHLGQSHLQSSTNQRSQGKFSHTNMESSWNQELGRNPSGSSSSSVPKERSSSSKTSASSSKHKSVDSSYSSSGNGSYPLSNLRLMDGLTVSNVPKKSQPVSLYSSSSSSASSRPLVTSSTSTSQRSLSSVQPKVKQRNDSFPLTVSHPLLGTMPSEQQQELWQQMNAGGFLSGIPPGELYKYISQQSLYPNANTSGGTSKKSSQY